MASAEECKFDNAHHLSQMPGARWRVGFSSHASDDRVLKAIDNAAYESWYPQVKELRTVPKRKVTIKHRNNPIALKKAVMVPMWPRYIFVRFSLMDGKWSDLFRLIGIQGLVCNEEGGRHIPATINDDVIQAWRTLEVNGALPGRATARQLAGYKIGESVRIKNGAFKGYNGEVEKLPDIPIEELDESSRLSLLVAMFGGRAPVELELGDIEKL